MEEQKNVEPYGALPDYQRPICAVLSENNAYKLIDDTEKSFGRIKTIRI